MLGGLRTALRRTAATGIAPCPAGASASRFACLCTGAEERPVHALIPPNKIHVETCTYFEAVNPAMHLGPHPGNKKVILTLKVADIELPALAKARFKALCGLRFNANTGWLKLVGDELPTKEQNLEVTKALLSSLVDAAQDPAAWMEAHGETARAKTAAGGGASA